jgi:hypothetical protein
MKLCKIRVKYLIVCSLLKHPESGIFSFFFFSDGTRILSQGITLSSHVLYHLIHTCTFEFSLYMVFLFVCLFGWGLNSGHCITWGLQSILFCTWEVLWICLGLHRTVILPISASQVARITGVIHRCPGIHLDFVCLFVCSLVGEQWELSFWTQGLVLAVLVGYTIWTTFLSFLLKFFCFIL